MSNYLKQNQIYEIDSWKDFQRLVAESKYKRWAFRGQENSNWCLDTTLWRYLTGYKIHKRVWAHQEDRIIRLFRRKAELFLQHIPDDNDHFQWLALMQHHGAPTRLMDFTWSPFVAAFFALEKAKSNDCAVWAINFFALQEKKYFFQTRRKPAKPTRSKLVSKEAPRPEDLGSYRRFFIHSDVPFVTAGEPYNMNQRQIAQAGTFLIPGVIDRPIERILSAWEKPEEIIAQFILNTSKIRDEAMESLYYMNITNATLFPGLDGLARSLAYELEFHWAFDPKTGKDYPGVTYLGSGDD